MGTFSIEFVNKMYQDRDYSTCKLYPSGEALCGLISAGPTLLLKHITRCVTFSLFTAPRLREQSSQAGLHSLIH